MTAASPARVRGHQRPVIPPAAPARAAAGLAARQIGRGALLVAVLSAGMSALVAVQYRATVAGTLDVASLAALAANPAISTLFGAGPRT